jgi:exoribonuclease II
VSLPHYALGLAAHATVTRSVRRDVHHRVVSAVSAAYSTTKLTCDLHGGGVLRSVWPRQQWS